MKKFLAMFLCLGLVCALGTGMTGCKTEKDKDKAAKTPVKTDKDFALAVAADPSTAKMQLESKQEVKLTLSRGKDATEEVALAVEVKEKDKGVTATLDNAKVAGKDKDAKLTINVAKDASAGDFTVTITATSKGSKDATATVKVTVDKKAAAVDSPAKDYALKAAGPKDSVTIKQGAKGTAKVTVTMGKDLSEAALKVAGVKDATDKDAKGVTADAPKKSKGGDIDVSIAVAADAAEGEYIVWISATGENAKESSAKVNVKVEKK